MKKLFYETKEFLKEKVEKIESEILALTDDGAACCVSDDKGAYLAKLIEERKGALDALFQATLGKQQRANRLSTSYVEFAVVDVDNKPIFGQSVSIYYEKKCWLGGERFQINVGTCGSHDLLPEERGYTMADFYIGIGKLHANTELLETIKDALFYYAERIADIQKEVRELDELIKNPTRA